MIVCIDINNKCETVLHLPVLLCTQFKIFLRGSLIEGEEEEEEKEGKEGGSYRSYSKKMLLCVEGTCLPGVSAMSCVHRVHCGEDKYGKQIVGCMTFTFVMNDTYEMLERQDKQDFRTILIKGFKLWKSTLLLSRGQKGKRKKLIPAGFEPAPPKRPGP